MPTTVLLLVQRFCWCSRRQVYHIIALEEGTPPHLVETAISEYGAVGWRVCILWRGVQALRDTSESQCVDVEAVGAARNGRRIR